MKIKTGDNVFVRTGADKGKAGLVTKVLKKTGKVVVEGINKKIRHQKGRDGQGGERLEFFAPIDASNVAIMDENGKPSRVGYKMDNGNKVRIARTTGNILSEGGKASPKKTAKKTTKKKVEASK